MGRKVPVSEVCGCFPTGRHYAGIADRLAALARDVKGLAKVLAFDAQWHRAKLAVIDFETTGFDPKEARIIEIGVACFDGGVMTGMKSWFVNPGLQIPEEVRNLTGILQEDVDSAPPLDEVIMEFEETVAGHIPVAYNAKFDKSFAIEHSRQVKLDSSEPTFDPEVVWIDPLVWVRAIQKERKNKLADACERLGIPLDNAHRAGEDARAAGLVLMKLAEHMPKHYGELVRLQGQYAARQDVDMAAMRANWKK